MQNKIFLVGMPGSGKSTVGLQLAAKLNMPFIDLDQKIEEQAQCTIKEIFAQHGEAHFRELEQKALHNAVESEGGLIIATGGGAPCFFDNMDVIKANGVSVFIDTPLEELVARLNAYEKDKRPKFSSREGLKGQLEELYKNRLFFYEQADLRWNNATETADQLIESLKKLKKLD
ncbi:shikimate kinase [Fulvivirga ulvae]|uniref:shikimate kinase n=1 Tax=Fulvivirga ulvae TaxID=2904245 RepID=UPI001F1B8DD5|nr:shikimate kinase [Fulvivirga ulvae]UII33308.1 shikimate kinase [Fulvivirga ulvae]